jgi:hypothetical protein
LGVTPPFFSDAESPSALVLSLCGIKVPFFLSLILQAFAWWRGCAGGAGGAGDG